VVSVNVLVGTPVFRVEVRDDGGAEPGRPMKCSPSAAGIDPVSRKILSEKKIGSSGFRRKLHLESDLTYWFRFFRPAHTELLAQLGFHDYRSRLEFGRADQPAQAGVGLLGE
jgi:hypothetical protein